MNCPHCGNNCWSREEDSLVCICCGYIDYKPTPECIKENVKQRGGYEAKYIFYKAGKAKEVFDALEREANMEQKFGRFVEPININKN